jgi:hypothetical protein
MNIEIGKQKVNQSRRSCNCCLRRCRVVECAFGRLKAKFKILLRNTSYNDKNFVTIVETCIALHNFLHRMEGAEEEGPVMAMAPHAKEVEELSEYISMLPDPIRERLDPRSHDREGEVVRNALATHMQIVKQKSLTKTSQARLVFAHYLQAQ